MVKMQLTGEKRNAGEDRKIAAWRLRKIQLESVGVTLELTGEKRERGRPRYSWRREGDSWIQMAKLEPTRKERDNKGETGL